jgi:AcrR family transcriptional regulator
MDPKGAARLLALSSNIRSDSDVAHDRVTPDPALVAESVLTAKPAPPVNATREISRRTKRPDGLRRQEQIIAAATEILAKRGYAEAGLDEIGILAGVTGSAIYRHFGNKDELLEAVLNTALGDTIARVAEIVATSKSPYETLERLVMNVATRTHDGRQLSRTLWRDLRHLGSQGPGVFDRVHRLHVEEFVHVLLQLRPEMSEVEARTRVDAIYGLVLGAEGCDPGIANDHLQRLIVDMAMRISLSVDESPSDPLGDLQVPTPTSA